MIPYLLTKICRKTCCVFHVSIAYILSRLTVSKLSRCIVAQLSVWSYCVRSSIEWDIEKSHMVFVNGALYSWKGTGDIGNPLDLVEIQQQWR